MTLEEICALPIADVAYDDCLLLLWATNPKLYECMKVLDAWGLTYRTNNAWEKDDIGMGYYSREKHELLLVAKRGELPPPDPENRPESVQHFPRGEHSAKPFEYYDLIDRMYPGIRKLELFRRKPEPGKPVPSDLWSFWGNQA